MELWATKYLLEHSEPAFIFEWLSNNKVKNRLWSGEDRAELEKALLDRKDPVINLGLALYGSEHAVGEQLFKEGDVTIKRAVLSSPIIESNILDNKWVRDLVLVLLAEWENVENAENLWALFTNKHLLDEILVQLFEREAPFDSLDEERWIILCNFASQNDRLSTPYDDTYMDGWTDYKYHEVFEAAWRLFDKFPQTNMAASILHNFGENLISYKPSGMQVMKVIEKWYIDPNHEYADSFSGVRTFLAKLLSGSKFEALKDSDDLALRKAYYQYLSYPKPEQIKEGFEKDGAEFVETALWNENIFKRGDNRDALRQACWDAPDEHASLDLPNSFRARCSYWESKHPEWFKDEWSGDIPFDEIEDQDERIEKRIEHINSQVNGIHNILLGKQDNPYAEDPEQTITDYLRSEFSAIAELLVKLHNKNNAAWGWAIAGAAIGYIIARIY